MTPDVRAKIRSLLLAEESYRQFPYVDTTSHLTIGIGRNLTSRGISMPEALFLLENDISYFTDKLREYIREFDSLDENRQCVLISMCFNLGVQGFLNFTKMIAAIDDGNFDLAASEMLQSTWASQVPGRVHALSSIIRTGNM